MNATAPIGEAAYRRGLRAVVHAPAATAVIPASALVLSGSRACAHVPMDASLVKELVAEMSMSNAELRAKREREIREARSRQLLAGGQGNGGMPAIPLDPVARSRSVASTCQ